MFGSMIQPTIPRMGGTACIIMKCNDITRYILVISCPLISIQPISSEMGDCKAHHVLGLVYHSYCSPLRSPG